MTSANVPHAIQLKRDLKLPPALDEWRMLTELRSVASKNSLYRSYIGMGFYDCIVPGVILRNVFQSAGWITRYWKSNRANNWLIFQLYSLSTRNCAGKTREFA